MTEEGERFQIDEDLVFERRQQKVQRFSWAIMGLVVLAALLGAFGHGLLAQTLAKSPDGRLIVDYDRIMRRTAPTDLEVLIDQPGETVELVVDGTLLRELDVETAQAEATEVRRDGEDLVFVIPASAAGTTLRVVFHVTPRGWGLVSGRVGLAGDDPAELSILVLP